MKNETGWDGQYIKANDGELLAFIPNGKGTDAQLNQKLQYPVHVDAAGYRKDILQNWGTVEFYICVDCGNKIDSDVVISEIALHRFQEE